MVEFKSYVKLGVVGRGAFGVCYAYHRPRIGKDAPRKVIIKSIPIEGLSAEEQDKLEGEARMLQCLKHPNIITCYSYGTNQAASELWIEMHFAEGGTLQKLISEQRGEYLPELLIKFYFAQLAQALRYLHSKPIIHRDLKTQNILMNRKRTTVLLGDFGISKELNNTVGMASTCIGTPNYFSPEMLKGERYGEKSDMWALGCILYEMIELKRAFDGPRMLIDITEGRMGERKNTNVSHSINEMVQLLLNVDPDQRLSAEAVITHPSVLRTCIDITLDFGRADNSIERLVAESIYSNRSKSPAPAASPTPSTLLASSGEYPPTRIAATLQVPTPQMRA
ncbi:BMA-NEKL-2, isoform b [Aphelenchoides fujianensis]|nr:BMA-NEKL-2, isoform b [Aphelenchoides fujianensis]